MTPSDTTRARTCAAENARPEPVEGRATSSWSDRITTSVSFRFARGFLNRFHHAQEVAAENLRDVRLRIALLQQRVGDPRQLRRILHPQRHRRAVEIGAKADVI